MADDRKRKYFLSGRNLLAREYPIKTGQKNTSSLQIKKPDNKEKGLAKEEDNSMKEVSFEDLNLHPNLLKALQNLHYIVANKVQMHAFSFFSDHKMDSLKIFAPRKSGKTTAIFLCILNELFNNATKKYKQALILCPTVELAESCYLCAQQLTEFCPFELYLLVEGMTFNRFRLITENIIITTLDKATDIICSIDPDNVQYLFFDDAECFNTSMSQYKIFARISNRLLSKCRIIVATNAESRILENFFKENISMYCNMKIENVAAFKKKPNSNFDKKEEKENLREVLFVDMNLHPNLLKALENLHFITANKIQIDALSFFSEGTRESLKICAPRKCGKTTAVFLCILNELLNNATKKYKQALILCPTLELAEMCYLCVQQLTELCPLALCLAVKGKSFNKKEKITENIIIATPDKALDLSLVFENIQYLFIDDADYLKNSMNHFKIFAKICEKLSSKCRIIVTTDSESQILKNFIKENKNQFFSIKIESQADYTKIKQFYVVYNNPDEKLDALVHFTARSNQGQTVIFCETKEVVVQLEELLQSKNIGAIKLFGSLSSENRKAVLEQFKNEEIQVLVTTQAYLHVIPSDHITHIINFEQLFDKKGLILEEYEKRRCLLNKKSVGTFVSLVHENYKNFFFRDKTVKDEKIFYNNAEIMNVEGFKNL